MTYRPGAQLTVTDAKTALEEGLRAIEAGASDIDLGGVNAVDSAAVAILLAWERAAMARGARIRFLHAPPALCSLASLYGVFGMLHFTKAQPEAGSSQY